MTTSESLERELQQLLSRLLVGVGYAVGIFTVVSLYLISLKFALGWCFQDCSSRVARAHLDIKNLAQGLSLYRLKQGRYPSTEEGLRALVGAEILESVPRDPWNAEYSYALHNGRPRVWSLGADGRPGGTGDDSDLYSRPLPL